jgi:hypothetical protein
VLYRFMLKLRGLEAISIMSIIIHAIRSIARDRHHLEWVMPHTGQERPPRRF